jgi:hypothetical protein
MQGCTLLTAWFLRQCKSWAEMAVSDQDRRAYPRYPSSVETVCRLVNEPQSMQAKIRNVSRVGINLMVKRNVEPGTMLQVDLPYHDGRPETILLACVMRTIEEPNGLWSVGCMFSEELSDEEMHDFGGLRQKSTEPDDKRIWKRFPVKGLAEYQRMPADGVTQGQADILNISASGVGLQMAERVEPGVVLNLELRKYPSATPFTILACAVYLAERGEGGWLVGCNFIRELELNELKQLSS